MTHRAFAILLLGLVLLPTAGPAQQDDPISRELAGIRRSLTEIVQILRQRTAQEEKSLLLRRIELKNTRLVPVESATRIALDSQRHLENEERRLTEYRDQLASNLAGVEIGSDEDKALRNEMRSLDLEIDRFANEAWVEQQKVLDLDGERKALLLEIEELESRLDRQ